MQMNSRLGRVLRAFARTPVTSAPLAKASRTGPLVAFDALRQPVWTPRDYTALATAAVQVAASLVAVVALIVSQRR